MKVSVIVAIYNSEKFLKKNIESIINQTYKDIEIILVDDGSPDKCPEICDYYANRDNRIRVIHKKNGGTCDARNAGLAVATGEYVTIIDGDDWLEEDYVEYLYRLIRKYDVDMAMTDHVFTTRDRVQINDDKTEFWTSEKAATEIIYPRFPIGPWNKLYSMKMLKKNNLTFSVPWSGEGLYFGCMAAQYSNGVALGHKKIYNYRLNNTGSGLTHHNVIMGTNALRNIKYIKDVSIIKSKAFMNAVDWHIWKNYYFVLYLIVATDSCNQNKKLLKECKAYLRKNIVKVVLFSRVNIKEKIKMILKSFVPIQVARKELKISRVALEKDKME